MTNGNDDVYTATVITGATPEDINLARRLLPIIISDLHTILTQKLNDNMDKRFNAFTDGMEKRFNAFTDGMEKRFDVFTKTITESIEVKFKSMQIELMQAIDERIDQKINTLVEKKWNIIGYFVGTGIVCLGALFSIFLYFQASLDRLSDKIDVRCDRIEKILRDNIESTEGRINRLDAKIVTEITNIDNRISKK